jgi:hypothetical protein
MSRIAAFHIGQTRPDQLAMEIVMPSHEWKRAIASLERVTSDDDVWHGHTLLTTPLAQLMSCQYGTSPTFGYAQCIELDHALTARMPRIMHHKYIDDEDKTSLLRLQNVVQVAIEIVGKLEVSA